MDNQTPKPAAQKYLEKQVLSASPVERIVMLYDGAIRNLLHARTAIEDGDINKRYIHNKKAGDIISYLLETLDMEKGGEIAGNLQQLYLYMLQKLMEADIKNSAEPLDDVLVKLRTLRASWEKLARGEAVPPENTVHPNTDNKNTGGNKPPVQPIKSATV